MKLLLALDQGSTKTHALICTTSGEILGKGAAPGSLHTTRGMDEALDCMGQAARDALKDTGYTEADIAYVSGGITGIDYPYEKTLLTHTIGDYFHVPYENVCVENDCVGALWGGTFDVPAVVCCAGTGLNVCGVDEKGKMIVFGNYCNGLFGGGGTIGQAALQAVFDAHIGKEPETTLTEKCLKYTGAENVDDLLLLRYRKKTVNPSKLCPLVFEAAGEGDEVAISILSETAEHWSRWTLAMLKQLNLSENAEPGVVLSGSVFKGKPTIPQKILTERVTKIYPKARMMEAVYEPVVGGAAMGLVQYGTEGWKQALTESATRLMLRRRSD